MVKFSEDNIMKKDISRVIMNRLYW